MLAAMGLLTFGINVTLDGCCDHTAGIADDELHDHFTALMDSAGAMLWGRTTYEMMEAYWPAVAGDEQAPRAEREWAMKLDAKPKYVVSTTRRDFPWQNTVHLQGDLRAAVQQIKDRTPDGVLIGSLTLGAELERLELIDEYRLVVHPVLAGRGPRLFEGLPTPRQLELVSSRTFKAGQTALHLRRRPT
jgi:dihydrofolate reductase